MNAEQPAEKSKKEWTTDDIRRHLVDMSIPEPNTGCWLWTGIGTYRGHGKSYVGRGSGSEWAHRLSYEMFVGAIPRRTFVCHRCDAPPCVNPAHLFLGTHADNMIDMSKKGRAYGQKRPYAPRLHARRPPLSEDEARDILWDRRRRSRQLAVELAATYEITVDHVRAIWRGDAWRDSPKRSGSR